jgi:hypothetical protein
MSCNIASGIYPQKSYFFSNTGLKMFEGLSARSIKNEKYNVPSNAAEEV